MKQYYAKKSILIIYKYHVPCFFGSAVTLQCSIIIFSSTTTSRVKVTISRVAVTCTLKKKNDMFLQLCKHELTVL